MHRFFTEPVNKNSGQLFYKAYNSMHLFFLYVKILRQKNTIDIMIIKFWYYSSIALYLNSNSILDSKITLDFIFGVYQAISTMGKTL